MGSKPMTKRGTFIAPIFRLLSINETNRFNQSSQRAVETFIDRHSEFYLTNDDTDTLLKRVLIKEIEQPENVYPTINIWIANDLMSITFHRRYRPDFTARLALNFSIKSFG